MKLYGLIGYPLGHSFSKKYFTEKFEKEKIDGCSYESFPIESIDKFPQLLLDNPNLQGINVTIPYKVEVMKYLDELDASAEEIGAVNCIKREEGKLTGYNTDAYGFAKSIKPFLAKQHEKALILGTGGASKAIEYVLKQLGVTCFFVSRIKKEDEPNSLSYEELNHHVMETCKLIVNCSPVGTFPNIDQAPAIPYNFITSEHFLYDLVYNPIETEFLKRGKQKGAIVLNGLPMLENQAEEAWRIWNEK